MLNRYLQQVNGSVTGGIATWSFPPLPMGMAANVSYAIPEGSPTTSWTVLLNGIAVGGMVGTGLYGPFYVVANDAITITGQSTSPAPVAVATGVIGYVDEVTVLPPVTGGGVPQAVTVNADELQGVPISTTLPTSSQGLVYDGSQWAPANIVNNLAAGTGIAVSSGSGNVTVTNTGVTSVSAGSGITVNETTGAVTVTNAGVTSITNTNPLLDVTASGTAVTISGSVSNSNPLIAVSASGGLSISGSISNTSPLLSVSASGGSTTIAGNSGAAGGTDIASNLSTFGTSWQDIFAYGPITGTFLILGSFLIVNSSASASVSGQVAFSKVSGSVSWSGIIWGGDFDIAPGYNQQTTVLAVAAFSGTDLYLGGAASTASQAYIAGGAGGSGVANSGITLLQIA